MKRAGFESQLGYRAGIAVARSAMSSMQALGDAGSRREAVFPFETTPQF
jgi:hypothetical protein